MRLSILALSLVLCNTLSLAATTHLPTSNLTLTSASKVCTTLRTPPKREIKIIVPGTTISLTFTCYKSLLYQTETDLCIIEALADFFAVAVRKKGDSILPLNYYVQSYGEVNIRVDDFMPPSQRVTYATLVSTYRGLGLFFSLYGYFEVDFDIRDGEKGIVGSGSVTGGGRPRQNRVED